MNASGLVKEHMAVVCSAGGHVGTVDHVMGDKIKLTKNDSTDGKHHLFPASLVAKVDDTVHLSVTGDELKQAWTAE